MPPSSSQWLIWALASALFAALTAIFAKLGVANINSHLATFLRTCVITVLLGAFVFTQRESMSLSGLTPRNIVFLVLSALATGASWLCYFRALQLGEASRVAPIDKLSVVIVALLAVVFLGEKLSALHIFGVVLISAGAILIAL